MNQQFTVQQLQEVVQTLSSASGTVTHDFSRGQIWQHATPASNFTANFTGTHYLRISTDDSQAGYIKVLKSVITTYPIAFAWSYYLMRRWRLSPGNCYG